MNIYEKLSNIQQELKAPKNQRNNFGNYKYRSCEDILVAVKPLCKKNKVALVLSDELIVLGDNNPTKLDVFDFDKKEKELVKTKEIILGSQRYYIKATARLIDTEDIMCSVENYGYAREEEIKTGMDGSQITGTASSYARKYALNGLFSIDDNKDSDSTNIVTKDLANELKANTSQLEIIYGMENLDLDKVFEYYKVKRLAELTMNQAQEIINKKKKESK